MKISKSEAINFQKHGVNMWLYLDGEKTPEANVLYLEVNGGHYEEFYHDKSTFIYYVLEGNGSFYLNGEETKVKSTDLVVAKPGTKIYYLGKMKLLLTCTPAWKEKYEHHVRNIPK